MSMTHLPEMTMIGCTTKYINHSKLMPNLHANEKEKTPNIDKVKI